MGKSRYKLTGGKKNGFASFPKTLVEAIFWDKKKQPLEEVLDGKIDQPLDPAYVGKVPQVAQDGTVDWVTPLAGSTADSAMSDSSTNAPQNKVVKAYVDTVDGKVSQLGQELIMGGLKYLEHNMVAWSDWVLPFVIPASTRILIVPDSANTISYYLNYGTAEQEDYTSISGNLDIAPIHDVSKIRVSESTRLKIYFYSEILLSSNSVKTETIIDDVVTTSKISGQHIVSSNLVDKTKFKDGFYVAKVNGGEYANSGLAATGYIPVLPNRYYIGSPNGIQGAFYDRNKAFISGVDNFNAARQAPENAAFLRTSFYIVDKDTAQINEGQIVLPYEQFYQKVKNLDIIGGFDEDSYNSLNPVKVANARLWNGYLRTSVASISNGVTMSLSDYPKALKKGDKISFFAKVTSWGNGITIGKGVTDYNACYAVIDGTNIVLKSYASGAETTHGTVAHGLSFDTFVKVVIDISATKWNFIVQTLAGTFETEINCSYGNGTPRVTSNGASLTDAELSCTNSDFSKPIWMFGDSYFGIAFNNRELYWLNQWGYLNVLVQGYAGQTSVGAFAELEKCIAISKPKYLVWCIGMNDNSSLDTWKGYVANVKSICDAYGVTLILGTIPKPLSANYNYKDEMSAWIREESGCRYIDVAKAVGSNNQGQWYGYGETYDYQSTDNVHPTEYGAKAIATQFIIDLPEIMQY